MILSDGSEMIKKYLKCIKKTVPRPWIKPLVGIAGMLTGVESKGTSLINVDVTTTSMGTSYSF